MNQNSNKPKIERWGMFEIALKGPKDGNPFLDIELSAEFRYKNRVLKPDGFYDGDGTYKVRFMPDTLGEWSYVTKSNCPELDGVTGTFTCIEPSSRNHGPVRVKDTYHFAYEDGTPFCMIPNAPWYTAVPGSIGNII